MSVLELLATYKGYRNQRYDCLLFEHSPYAKNKQCIIFSVTVGRGGGDILNQARPYGARRIGLMLFRSVRERRMVFTLVMRRLGGYPFSLATAMGGRSIGHYKPACMATYPTG